MRVMKWSMIALAVSAGTTQFAMASSQDEAKGFIEDSTLTSKTRMLYMNRDYRNGAGNIAKEGGGFKSGYREDWGLSELLNYEGPFGVGYAVAAFTPEGANERRAFDVLVQRAERERLNSIRAKV